MQYDVAQDIPLSPRGQRIADPAITVGDYYRFDMAALDADDNESFVHAVMEVSMRGFSGLKPNMKRWRQSMFRIFAKCIKKIPGPKRSHMDAFVLSSSLETCLEYTRIHGEDGRVVNFKDLPLQREVRESLGISNLPPERQVSTPSSSSSSETGSHTDTSCTLVQDIPEVNTVGVAIVAKLHRLDLRWTEALLFFVEVAQHAFEFRRPTPAEILTQSEKDGMFVCPQIAVIDRYHRTRMCVGKASCHSISIFELCGGRVGAACISHKFTRLFAVDDKTIAIEMRDWTGQSTLSATDFLNHATFHEHMPHDLVKGWSIETEGFVVDEAALQCLLRTAEVCVNAFSGRSLSRPFTRPIYHTAASEELVPPRTSDQDSSSMLVGTALAPDASTTSGEDTLILRGDKEGNQTQPNQPDPTLSQKRERSPADDESGEGGSRSAKRGKGQSDSHAATPPAIATASSAKMNFYSSHCDNQSPSKSASEDDGYAQSLVERWAAGIAQPTPDDQDAPPVCDLEDELEDESLIQSQMAMPDEVLDSDEEEEGLTGDQAVSILARRGVHFKILNTVEFDLLLSKAFGCGAVNQRGA